MGRKRWTLTTTAVLAACMFDPITVSAFTGTGAGIPTCAPEEIAASFGNWSAQVAPTDGALLWSQDEQPVKLRVALQALNPRKDNASADAIAMDITVTDDQWAHFFENDPRLRLSLMVGDTRLLSERTASHPNIEDMQRAYRHYEDLAMEEPASTGKIAGDRVVVQGFSFKRGYHGQVPLSAYLQVLSYADALYVVAVELPETADGALTYPAHYQVSPEGLAETLTWLDAQIDVFCRVE